MAASQPRLMRPLPARPRPALAGVPVFLYHGLTDGAAPPVEARERKYWVPVRSFEQQLAAVRKNAFRAAMLDEVLAGPAATALAARVVFTFDDGRISDYTRAFPRLQQAGIRAHFFVNTSLIGRAGYLDWSQMRQMSAAGMSFESHGCEHLDMSVLGPRRLRAQLSDSKRILEDGLGVPVRYFGAPYGSVCRAVIEAARQAGYRAVCTSRNLPTRSGAATVNRIAIYSGTTAAGLEGLLLGEPAAFAGRLIRSAMLWAPKQVLRGVRALQLSASGSSAREAQA